MAGFHADLAERRDCYFAAGLRSFGQGKGLAQRPYPFPTRLEALVLHLITVAGLTIGTLIGGALVVETIFALPGVGRLLIGTINSRDFMMVQGAVALIVVGFVLVNFAIDTLYSVLDPRVAR
jgi:peptide/nickel transport system permease protein